MSVSENGPIRRQHFDVTDVERELSRPLDTAASRGNKGENPILFSVCSRHLSPRLSEQKNRANVLPSESLSSPCSKVAFCASGSCSRRSGARRRAPGVEEGGRDALRAGIGQGFPRSPPPSTLPGRAVGLEAAAPPRPRWPVRRAGQGSGRRAVSASTPCLRPARSPQLHLIGLLRNLYAGQEATVRTGYGRMALKHVKYHV